MESPLRIKSTDFAIRVIRLYQYLTSQKNEYVLSKQILKCGTNPGAMVREAANAESGADFIHKMGIAQKELGETQYWLEILQKTDYITLAEHDSLYKDSEEIMKMVRCSILTKKKNLKGDNI
ncbi:MAG: four helix bundle protein [Spirosomataceae bacterium]